MTIFYESRWGVGGKLRKGRKGRELKILWWITITASFLLGRAGCLALHRDGISRHGVSSPPCTSTSAPRAAPDRDFDRSRCRGPSCSTYRESSVNLRSRKTFEFSKITDRTFEFSSWIRGNNRSTSGFVIDESLISGILSWINNFPCVSVALIFIVFKLYAFYYCELFFSWL